MSPFVIFALKLITSTTLVKNEEEYFFIMHEAQHNKYIRIYVFTGFFENGSHYFVEKIELNVCSSVSFA